METTNIWNEFSESLKGFILSRVKNIDVANDLLQEVFIKVHLNIHNLEKQKSLKSWIFTITSNVINDYFRKNSKSNSIVIENIELDEEINEEHSAKDCIIPLIKNLPNTYKEAVYLSEIKGVKQAEIAKQLNLSLSGAKSRIQRGRELLKQGFISCCDYKLNELGHLIGEHKDVKDCKICSPSK
jgi:RNA polymerase sigma-70 factor (ECF subfamily)